MGLNILILLSFILILGILVYLLSIIKNKETAEKGGNNDLQNKLNEVSSDINKIEIDLASVSAPIYELNRFLGGNVTTGRLGEWNMEEIVRDILPSNAYEFQAQINPATADRADCAINTADGLIIPIDSKFYAGKYQSYQSAGTDTERKKVLKDLKRSILNDAEDISQKYILQNQTSNYVVLYIASEKLVDLAFQIDNLRQECFSEKNTLILGPNSLAAFLDTVQLGHHYQSLNDSARDVHKVVNKIKTEFFDLDLSAENVIKRLDLALKDVQKLQTRVNVLGKELKKGSETLEEGLDKE
tara:strand:- start:30148 stop:31047 length:900 start_codon:yes stop_codon:yes gene_type:complete